MRTETTADRVRYGHQPVCQRLWLAAAAWVFLRAVGTIDVHLDDARHCHAAWGDISSRNSFSCGQDLRYLATLGTLALPTVFALITLTDAQGQPIPAWKAIWPVFGATNQLLAGLTLIVLAVWLRKTSRNFGFVLLPLVFMTTATIYALVLLIQQYGLSMIGGIAVVLLALSMLLIIEGIRNVRRSVVITQESAQRGIRARVPKSRFTIRGKILTNASLYKSIAGLPL